MPVLRFHLLGDWFASEVRTRWAESSHAAPDEARELIDAAWRRAERRPGIRLFDGPMCRMESWQVDAAGVLHFAFSRTSYKQFFGTNLSHPELADRFGRSVLANAVGVSPALETSDGWLLMGRRNASVAYYPERIHPFAGALEPDDVPAGRGDELFAAIRRELAEELHFADADVAEVRCTGVVEDVSLLQPEVIFRALSTRTRAEVEARVDRHEHHGSVAIAATPEGVAEALGDPALTPVGLASLLLWGRVRFGSEWFENESRRFL